MPNAQFAQTFPGQNVPGQNMAYQPISAGQQAWQGTPQPAPRMPVTAAMATSSGNNKSLPPPKIRLQAPETLIPSARIALPSPEELGLAAAPAATVSAKTTTLDWNFAHSRLQRLSAVGFHIDRLSDGGFRVTFLLPTNQSQRTHHIESEAQTEAAAVLGALDQAEAWMRTGR